MRHWRAVGLAAVLCVAPAISVRAQQVWLPIPESERTLTKPLIDPNADAEVLLWDVAITATGAARIQQPRTVVDNYFRIKVFNDRGRAAASTVELRLVEPRAIRNIGGRTIAPDGTVIELAPADIHQRTALQTAGVTINLYSFVLPAVVAGSVIEYRWQEVRDGELPNNLSLPLQHKLPAHLVRYTIKSATPPGYVLRTQVFGASTAPQMTQSPGTLVIQMARQAAARPEPWIPHEMADGAWMFIHYAKAILPAEEFWTDYARNAANEFTDRLKINGDLTSAAAQATAGLTSPEDKVKALAAMVRQRVRLVPGGTGAGSARDTLKKGSGSAVDLAILFTALARAAGLDAYLAQMPDRETFVAEPALKLPYFYRRLTTVVRSGARWSFLDMGNEYAPAGQLRWQQEGTPAIVLDAKAPQFLLASVSSRESSRVRRTAALQLSPNGDLEGDVAFTYSGHLASMHRAVASNLSQAERTRYFTDRMTRYIDRAMVSDLRIEGLSDANNVLAIRYRLTIPNAAVPVGTDTLRLNPSVLPRELVPPFTAATRTRPVEIQFPWSEEDVLTFTLPDGYRVDLPANRPRLEAKEMVGVYERKFTTTDRTLVYSRSLAFGLGTLRLPASEYPGLKAFFDDVSNDRPSVTFRREEKAP